MKPKMQQKVKVGLSRFNLDNKGNHCAKIQRESHNIVGFYTNNKNRLTT